MSEVTQVLSKIESGDPSAAEQLLPLVCDELRSLPNVMLLSRPRSLRPRLALVPKRHQRATAEANRRVRRLLYIAHMQAAQQAWEQPDIKQALALLERHRPKPGQEDLRGFEWHYLWRLCHLSQQEFELKVGFFTALAISPDGESLAIGTGDSIEPGALKLVSFATGTTIKRFGDSTAW
jgi:hypothetical protein